GPFLHRQPRNARPGTLGCRLPNVHRLRTRAHPDRACDRRQVPVETAVEGIDMATSSTPHDKPILVTGAAGDVGAIGRNVTALLLAKGHRVRAMVRREDERAEALRRLGAEVVQGDLT